MRPALTTVQENEAAGFPVGGDDVGGKEGTWRIIPVSKWLRTIVSKSPNWGYSLSKWPKWLINGGYYWYLLTNWDDPPSRDVGCKPWISLLVSVEFLPEKKHTQSGNLVER